MGEEAVPTELIGRWMSDDPRYADRALEIEEGGESRSASVPGMHMTYQVQGIEREEGCHQRHALPPLLRRRRASPSARCSCELPTPGRLRIDNHSELWTRATAPGAGGLRRAPESPVRSTLSFRAHVVWVTTSSTGALLFVLSAAVLIPLFNRFESATSLDELRA